MMQIDRKKILQYFAALGLAAFLFLGGFYFGDKKTETVESEKKGNYQGKEIRQSGYKFISPLLECEPGESAILKSSEIKMKKAIQEEVMDKNKNSNISLYFRDLNIGPSFGINELENFSPASLLKVPLMIAYYKLAENDPQILDRVVEYAKASTGFQQEFSPQKHIQLGIKYKVSELIEAMIRYSDNEATNLLFQNISHNKLKIVFDDLGIKMPDIYDLNNAISVKDYAAFFRIIYNSSYLERNMSEKALELLSAVEYKEGLLSGIPAGVIVSHKFGERQSTDEKGIIVRQLHDCGIVYYPGHPYLICVMTRGQKFEELSQIISKISKIVYEEIDSAR